MSTLTGVLAGLTAAGGWALASHLFARAFNGRSRSGPAAANLFKNALALAVFGVVWIAVGWSIPPAASWAWLGLSGLLGFALGDALYFAALPRCGVQLSAMSVNLIPPLAALMAFLFYGEALPALALAAMALALVGIALVVADRGGTAQDFDPRARRVGLAMAMSAATLQAVAIVTGRVGFEGVDLLPGTVIRLVGGVVGALVVAVVVGLRRGTSGVRGELRGLTAGLGHRGTLLLLLPPTLCGAVFNLPLHSLALGSLSPGVSAILFATTPILALPIGLYFGERYGRRAAIGTLLAFVGVVGVVLATAQEA